MLFADDVIVAGRYVYVNERMYTIVNDWCSSSIVVWPSQSGPLKAVSGARSAADWACIKL
jgi:hypothetical protein